MTPAMGIWNPLTVFYIKTVDGKELVYTHVNLEVQAMMWNGEIPLPKIKLMIPVMGIWNPITFTKKPFYRNVFKSIHVYLAFQSNTYYG